MKHYKLGDIVELVFMLTLCLGGMILSLVCHWTALVIIFALGLIAWLACGLIDWIVRRKKNG